MRSVELNQIRTDLLTIEVEDYYQVGSFYNLIESGRWHRFDERIVANTGNTLRLLRQFDVKATFFVLGWVAERVPRVVEMIAADGHEVASKGYLHRPVYNLTADDFRRDLERGREAIEAVTGQEVKGYRVAHRWLAPDDLWVLRILSQEGYTYDSSLGLLFRRYAAQSWKQSVHQLDFGDQKLWEFPLSSWELGGFSMPISGGNYYRQFPHRALKGLVKKWHEAHKSPFIMYFHIWELDPDQPRINTGSVVTRIRHYRNLDKMHSVLEDYFSTYRFTSISDWLDAQAVAGKETEARWAMDPKIFRQINQPKRRKKRTKGKSRPRSGKPIENASREGVTVVVPCYNEESNLSYLANTLKLLKENLNGRYNLQILLVDDASRDNTWKKMQELFSHEPDFTLIRHEQNKGVSGAILTGITNAEHEVVCSIDCDCTYDPLEIGEMLPLLTDDVAMVTASPYHTLGKVKNVPGWRLTLSKSASRIYKMFLRQKISTYTSCFRAYRRSAILELDLKERDFLGIAEIVCQLDLRRSRIVEFPTTLESRIMGHSSMKIIRTIGGHVRLLARYCAQRLRQRFRPEVGVLVANAPVAVEPAQVAERAMETTEQN